MDPIKPTSFAALAGAACPGHAELAVAMTAEIARVDGPAVDAQLDLLALELAGARSLAPAGQLAELTDIMRAFAAVEPHVGSRDLRIDRVLHTCEGHPLALATIAVDAARRAGLDVGIIGDGHTHVIAHRQLEQPLAVDLGSASRGPRVRTVDGDAMGWRCAHQVCFTTLGELISRAVRGGDIGLAIRAAELRLELPLGDAVRDCQEGALARLRARLN